MPRPTRLLCCAFLTVASALAAPPQSLARAPKEKDLPVLVKQELRVARAAGLVSFNAGARFAGRFVQEGDAPIVIEAEMFDDASLQQGDGVCADPQASGGGFIHFIERATYTFTVATPGRYILWQRASAPFMGGWCHSEWLDGAHQNVRDGTLGPEDGWVWKRSSVHELTAGQHTLSLNYCAGAAGRAGVLAGRYAARSGPAEIVVSWPDDW